jgi:hypothetical protein
MASIILTHLGDSIPLYIKDCVHQIRLWNYNSVKIYIILDSCHKSEFWTNLISLYSVILVYTDTLVPTNHHMYFKNNFQGDTEFRKGYWKHVKERFFYIEELILRDSLEHVISMEYDVLLYIDLNTVLEKFKTSHQTLRIVRDNDSRGHPAFIYIPTSECIKHFNMFIVGIIQTPLEDMQALAAYANTCEDKIHYLPVITNVKNYLVKQRQSKCGHNSSDPYYLSEDSEHFGIVFDSLVVGQWVGGIDSRNTGGVKISNYENESALYNINEMKFQWKKSPLNFLWQPFLDDRVLATIHVHSKSLVSFMSDRPDYPKDDYNVQEIYKTLLPN